MNLLKEGIDGLDSLHQKSFSILSSSLAYKAIDRHGINELQEISSGYICFQDVKRVDRVLITKRFSKTMGYKDLVQETNAFYDDFTLKKVCESHGYKESAETINVGLVWVFNKEKRDYEAMLTYGKKLGGRGMVLLNYPIAEEHIIATQYAELFKERRAFLKFKNLSNREIDVLRCIKSGIKRSVIADELFMSIHTYDMHRKNIRKKLDINSFTEMTKFFKYIND